MLDPTSLQRLYRYGFSLTHSNDAAYDLLQDALEISLCKTPDKSHATIAYVRKIMRNRFIDQYRREQRHPTVSLDDDDSQPVNIDPRVLEDMVIAEHEVASIMDMLEPLERELLFFWAVEGYTAQEIADQTGSPRGTILSRIHRLRRKIIRQQKADDAIVQGGTA